MDPVNGWRLAIDIGTSNTAAAVQVGNDPPRPVRLSDQADQMPSAVLATPGGVIVGAEAVRSARVDPAAFEPNPKRRVGEGEILLGPGEVAVSALLAAVLRTVIARAVRVAGGGPPAEVVLTYPQQWQQGRRNVLLAAAHAAGLPARPTLVSEPVAAAGYYAARQAVPPGAMVAVFDFGGGTCDVAVLRATGGGVFEVLATDGLDPLGGEDLDDALAAWALGQLTAAGHADLVAALADPAALADRLTFREQVRGAKQGLTDYRQAPIPVAAGDRQAVVSITADEFDRLITPKIDAAIELTRRTLARAGVTDGAGLHALYLTGGSSHLLLVQRRLTELLGRPPATLEDPKLVVALGALSIPRSSAGSRPPDRPVPPGDRVPAVPAPGAGRPARRLRWVVGAGVGAIVLALTAGIGLLLSRDGDDDQAGRQTPSSAPPGSAAAPSTPPSIPPTSTRAGGCAAMSPDECTLASRLPVDFVDATTCAHVDPTGAEQVAVVRCAVPAASRIGANPGVTVIATQYATVQQVTAGFDAFIQTQGLAGVTASCFQGAAAGQGPWAPSQGAQQAGRMACFQDQGKASLAWTYDAAGVFVAAAADGPDVPAMMGWWSSADMSTLLRR